MNIEIEMIEAYRSTLLGPAREKVLYGGSSSGKTHAAQQYTLLRALEEPGDETLVVMETQTDVLIGMYEPMKDMLDSWGVPYIPHESVPTSITLVNEHIIYFTPIFRSKGPQSSEAFKKFNNVRRVVINEATALTWEDFLQLRNRTGRTKPAEIIFTFNPIDEDHWLCQRYVLPFLEGKLPEGIAVCHTTHRDNPYLTPEKHQEYEDLIEVDENYHRVYCLGLPGKLVGLIYVEGKNWTRLSMDEWPEDVLTAQPTSLGLDWGYSEDPAAALAQWDRPSERYVHELFYEQGLTISDIAKKLHYIFTRNGWSKRVPIFCDPSRPDNIAELVRYGFNALDATNDIQFGIDIVKGKREIISEESVHMVKEKRMYSWAVGKDGRPTAEPVDKNNHLMDAERYGIVGKHCQPRVTRLVVKPRATYQSPYASR